MIQSQNPSLPVPTQAVEIDAVILDLQLKLDTNLSWLSNGWGKIWRNVDTSSGSTLYFPEAFLGKQENNYNYFRITQDNDKMGQSFFVVGSENVVNFEENEFNYLQYNVGIVFLVNMELINATLLETEIFQQNLISEVRQVLTRETLGTPYKITSMNVVKEYRQVFAEFNTPEDRGVSHSPLEEFRFNITLLLPENCPITLDRCTALQNNLSQEDLCSCIIPSIDWNNFIGCLTPQQIADLEALICGPADCIPENQYSLSLDGFDEHILTKQNLPQYDIERTDSFTFSFSIKPDVLQEGHIINKFISPTGYFVRLTATGAIRVALLSNGGANGIQVITNPGVITINNWQKVTVTYDGSSNASGVKVYVNNVLQTLIINTDTLTGSIVNAQTLTFGAYVFAGRYYSGAIDTIRMWGIEFNATQVATDWNGGPPLKVPTEENDIFVNYRVGENSIMGLVNRHSLDGTLVAPLRDGFYYTQNIELNKLTNDIPT